RRTLAGLARPAGRVGQASLREDPPAVPGDGKFLLARVFRWGDTLPAAGLSALPFEPPLRPRPGGGGRAKGLTGPPSEAPSFAPSRHNRLRCRHDRVCWA